MNVLLAIYQWAHENPLEFTGIIVAITNGGQYVFGVLVSSLPAPTAMSSAKYQYSFKVLNTFAANLSRAKLTAVESSPNFQDAVNRINATLPDLKPVVIVEPPTGNKQ